MRAEMLHDGWKNANGASVMFLYEGDEVVVL